MIPMVLLLGLWYSKEVTESLSLCGAAPIVCISRPSSGLRDDNRLSNSESTLYSTCMCTNYKQDTVLLVAKGPYYRYFNT